MEFACGIPQLAERHFANTVTALCHSIQRTTRLVLNISPFYPEVTINWYFTSSRLLH